MKKKKAKRPSNSGVEYHISLVKVTRESTFEKDDVVIKPRTKEEVITKVLVTMAVLTLKVQKTFVEITVSQAWEKGKKTPEAIFVPKEKLQKIVEQLMPEDKKSSAGEKKTWYKGGILYREEIQEKIIRILVGFGINLWNLPEKKAVTYKEEPATLEMETPEVEEDFMEGFSEIELEMA